jgi:magnesium chelatase subunit H
MIRYLVSRYSPEPDWNRVEAKAPVDYPDVGLYHPDLPGTGIVTDRPPCPRPAGRRRRSGS